MHDWTPEQWGVFLGALALFITTAIIPLMQILTNRKVNKLEKKVEASAAVSDDNNIKLTEVHNAITPGGPDEKTSTR